MGVFRALSIVNQLSDKQYEGEWECLQRMDDLRFYVLFNSISVISERCSDDNERLCAMELRLRLSRFYLK